MPRKKIQGRPLVINSTLIDEICRAADVDMLPLTQIRKRFGLNRQTLRDWVLEGRKLRGEPMDDLLPRAILCVELAERLDKIYAAHEEQLREVLRNPEIATAARLVMCIKPDYAFVEAAAE